MLVPLQITTSVRRWSPRLHRWSGRLIVAAALAVVLTGLFFGVGMPFGGRGEAAVTLLAAALCLAALLHGLVAIRRGQVERHRAWMLRGVAVLVGISTIRVVGGGLDLMLTPLGVPPRTVFTTSLWLGWALSVAAMEIWIRRLRAPPVTELMELSPRPRSDVG